VAFWLNTESLFGNWLELISIPSPCRTEKPPLMIITNPAKVIHPTAPLLGALLDM
jgi:hypothetical protein